MNHYIKREVLPNDISLLSFEAPGQKANVLNAPFLKELDHYISELETAPPKGLIIQSGKPGIFLAGADLKALVEADQQTIPHLIRQGQELFDRLEALPLPKVVLINGACLGGGLELSLTADWRIASLEKSTRMGLPEVNLGLLPAWGGCTRLPRLIGYPQATSSILSGKIYNAVQAKRIGLVDEVVHKENLLEAAKQFLKKGRRKHKFRMVNVPPVPQFLAAKIKGPLRRKTQGNYPAPLAVLSVITKGMSVDHESSLQNENDEFTKLHSTPVHESLLRLHFLQEKAKKNPGYDIEVPYGKIRSAVVLGGGIMGSGIAHWLSSRGIRVILKDVFPDTLAQGMASIRKLYSKAVKNRIMTEVEARQGLDRITPVSGDISYTGVDLVIEAIVEKLELKRKVFAEIEELVSPETLLATNTSALPISEIGKDLKDPSRLVGLHFFNPVLKMPLLEIVETDKSSKERVAQAFAFAHQIGKTPVLAKDRPGFLVNRILIPYLMEALQLFESGEPVKRIDDLMLKFGMPMGPLRLLDEIGLDTAMHVAGFLTHKLPKSGPIPTILPKMVSAGFLGKKSGKGFYTYAGKNKPPVPNPELRKLDWKLIRGRPWQNLLDRMVFSMINEAARCLDEGVSKSSVDIDLAMVLGAGWCPHLGGPLYYADRMGFEKVAATLRDLARKNRPHFFPSPNLEQGFRPHSPHLRQLKDSPVEHLVKTSNNKRRGVRKKEIEKKTQETGVKS
jgi:3-hydroxyacyl-CoA dehydrogenase/enoyl-CoA hydratase/3-hydroxybutyryl-CoA epimerase